MPFVRIALRKGQSAEYRKAISDAVHEALVETANVPPADRFQIISEHEAGTLIYDAGYLDIVRTDDIVVIQITLNQGRTLEVKKRLFARIAERLADAVKMRKEDVFINLVEVAKENWSFGNGIAQYAG
ncbi:MAG TPA: tautomerase family protein [Polyangiaceae bacterium]|nr:tautomerase family protein [Polyangiaceae bacterium]